MTNPAQAAARELLQWMDDHKDDWTGTAFKEYAAETISRHFPGYQEMREALQNIVEQAEYQRGTIYEISTRLYEKAQEAVARAERVTKEPR